MPDGILLPAATRIERIALKVAREAGLSNLRCEATDLAGTPDVVCDAQKVALFAHGCFWHSHGCRLSRVPATNQEFWENKFAANRARDIRVSNTLLAQGWRVIWLWECAAQDHGTADLARAMVAALAQGRVFFEIISAREAPLAARRSQ